MFGSRAENAKTNMVEAFNIVIGRMRVDYIAHKLIINGLEVEIGHFILNDDFHQQTYDDMQSIRKSLDKLLAHMKKEILNYKRFKNLIQESIATDITAMTMQTAHQMTSLQKLDSPEYVDMAIKLGESFLNLQGSWDI